MILVYRDLTSLNSEWLGPVWQQYWPCQAWDPEHTLDPARHVLWADYRHTQWTEPYRQAGYRIIVDHLFDSYVDEPCEQHQNVLTLRARDWIWIEEAAWWRHLGYDQHKAQPRGDRLFLLLMNLKKPWRDRLFHNVQPWLEHSIYSYHGQGHALSNDIGRDHGNWQRHFDPEWYNSTEFSVVAESAVTQRLWISEKTFKPLAHQHAAVVWGSPGTLAYIHSLGFETWPHVIDESYDLMQNETQRLIAVVEQINTLSQQWSQGSKLFADSRSKEILAHNFNHFFDASATQRLFEQQIIQPIQDFLHGTAH